MHAQAGGIKVTDAAGIKRMVALLDSSETGATGFSFSARMAGTGTSLLALSRNKQRRVLLLCNLPGKFAVVNVRTSDTLRDKNEFLRPSLKNSQVYFIFIEFHR